MSRDWETMYYEQQARFTESNGMLCQERDAAIRKRDEIASYAVALAKAAKKARDLLYEVIAHSADHLAGSAYDVLDAALKSGPSQGVAGGSGASLARDEAPTGCTAAPERHDQDHASTPDADVASSQPGRSGESPALPTNNAGWKGCIPKEPAPGLLMSMAIRYDHGFGIPGYYDQPMFSGAVSHAERLQSTLRTMRQLYEEVSGHGFYSPELEADYAGKVHLEGTSR